MGGRTAELLHARLDKVAQTMTREMGKTLPETKGEALRAYQLLQFYGGEAYRMTGETFPSASPSRLLYTLREPLGVVSVITPWNFPFAIPVWKVAPALAYGNTVVMKPSNLSPQCGVELARILDEVGLPPGVFNLVTGFSKDVGDSMVENPTITGVSFTGSWSAGNSIAQKAARNGIKCQLEMSGNNPLIVMEDANLEQASDIAVRGAFWTTGQKCTATKRIIVHKKVAKKFEAVFLDQSRKIRIGRGLDDKTQMGPMVSKEQLEHVLGYVTIGQEEGAKLLAGGKRLKGAPYKKGYFIEPTVFGNVTSEMRIAQEEVFGPFVCLMTVESLDDAIALANDTKYGLSASICTENMSYAREFVRKIDVGLVHINLETAGAEPHVPFGGMKASTSYYREMGRTAIEFFTQYKTVYSDLPA